MKIDKITINTAIDNATRNINDKAHDLYSALPKELPLEKNIYIVSQKDLFERIKNSILISISRIRK